MTCPPAPKKPPASLDAGSLLWYLAKCVHGECTPDKVPEAFRDCVFARCPRGHDCPIGQRNVLLGVGNVASLPKAPPKIIL